MAQFTEMRISEKTANPVKTIHGERDELEQQPWPRPLAPATIHTTATEMSDDQHHGENADDHPHKKSVLQKVKEKAKNLIKKKKKKQPAVDHGDEHREEEEHHHSDDDEDEEGEEEDTEEEEEEKARDLNPSDFYSRPLANPSPVSPELNAFSARTLLNGTELAKDPEAPEAPKTEVQWTSRDPNMLAGVASDHRARSPAETARRQQDVPAAPGQSSAGIAPILQSKEAAYSITARNPDYDLQKSDGYMTHQVQDIGTTGTATPDLTLQTEFDALPNYSRRKEAQENVLDEQDETERIEDSFTFAKSPPLPAGVMKPAIIEEPAMEKLIQRAGEVCGFDSSKADMAADVGSGDSTVKDQSPSATHGDTEESGSNEFKYAENKLEGTDINRHSNVSDEPQDFRAGDARSENFNENIVRSAALEAATSVVGTAIGVAQGLKDRIAMGLGGTVSDSPANENDKEREDEEGAGHDRSYTEKIYGVTSTAKNAIASKLGYGEHHEPADEVPNKPIQTLAEEDIYENNGGGKSYRDKIYDTASAAKNVISSKLGYGEHQVTVQENAEKKTDGLSADHDDGVQEKGEKSLTDKIYETASAANSVVSSKLGYGKQEDPLVEEKPEGKTMEKYEDEHDTGEGKSYTQKIYETATTGKNAISSKIRYGGKEAVRDHEQQIDEVSKGESNAYPVSYSN